MTWRTGSGEPRLLIRDGRTVGIADSVELAAEVVRALNERQAATIGRLRAMTEEADLRAKLAALATAEGGEVPCTDILQVLDGTYDPRDTVPAEVKA